MKLTKREREYLRQWMNRLIMERTDFVETCKVSGLKVVTFDDTIKALGRK